MLGFLPVRPAKALSYGDLEYGFCGPAGSEIFIMPCNPSVTGTVVIPEHINGLPVTMIEGYAFRDCIGMTELIVPETVVTIHENAFIGCDNLNYNHYDNGTYLGNVNNPYQLLISVSNEQSTYTIHSDTTGVADCAFQGTEVTSVILPEGVTEVPNRAFMDCTQLTTVGLSSNLSTVESSAFKNCTALTSVNLSRATYLGSSAFENCSSLTDVRMYWLVVSSCGK